MQEEEKERRKYLFEAQDVHVNQLINNICCKNIQIFLIKQLSFHFH